MKNLINIIIPNLLSWNGKEVVIGGLERYMINLAYLLTKMGYNVAFHQNANNDFKEEYLGWQVYGYEADRKNLRGVIERIENEVKGKVIYASILQQTNYRPNSICISHGVWWESPEIDELSAEKYYKTFVETALKQASLIISCDYNFLNVTRAIYPNLSNGKIRVIPNFVNLKEFYPRKGKEKKGIRLLYPRRIANERGFGMFIEVVPLLLERYPDLEVQFAIDKNIKEHLDFFHSWRERMKDKERITHKHPHYNEMPEIYADADIIAIPSIFSEGTSFSCLEAMAMGKAIIATDVGGLTNLIINGYNGLLIHPSKEHLYHAICYLIENPKECMRLGKSAYEIASAFSQEVWEKRWSQCINQIYPLED